MTSIGTRFYTWLKGEEVGRDSFGNRYYQEKGKPELYRRRRWVVYEGEVEASRVPPEWHSWLHYTADEPPPAERPKRAWAKPHQPNLTGTIGAYRPPGHELKGAHRAKGTGDYEPWTPG